MGLPLIGETWSLLRDPFGFLEERQRRYGDVFRSRVLGRRIIFLAGIEGAEAFYDTDNITREHAHPFSLVDLFGGTNMEMFDGPRHLALKTMALTAFDAEAIAGYLPNLQREIDTTLARFADREEILATEELRRLAIEAIWGNVMGFPDREETDAIARDYAAVLKGLTAIPLALPFSTYGRARSARDRLLDRIRRTIADRRARPGDDGLDRMLAATAPEAAPMTDDEATLEVHHIVIAGFIVYLLMAEVMRRLSEQPFLLERCAAEIDAHASKGPPSVGALAHLAMCIDVVREAKRSVPLVPLAFGAARRSFRCGGFDVPEGWTVYLALHLNNHDPRIFREPERFEPERFSPERAEHEAHPMAFIPQGAEPPTGHRCLGLDYSTFVVLTFMTSLIRDYTWTLPPQDLRLDRRKTPPEPRDGLRVRLRRRG
jgi:cytochrome P450